MPLAAHGTWSGDTLTLHALLGHPGRPGLLRAETQGQPTTAEGAEALGLLAADRLIEAGARDWLGSMPA
jgi:hydroxymethylbilane synthase